MKSKIVVSAIVALSLASSGIAFGQGNRDRDDRGRGNQYGKDNRDRNDNRGRDGRRDGRGAGPDHKFYRGDRLPAQYRNRSYVVNDWRGHQLSAPPRGYHWVQTGGDYVLAAIATGIILELFLAR